MSKLKKVEIAGIIMVTLGMIIGSVYVYYCYTGDVTPWLWQELDVVVPKWMYLFDLIGAWVLYIPACITIKKVCES